MNGRQRRRNTSSRNHIPDSTRSRHSRLPTGPKFGCGRVATLPHNNPESVHGAPRPTVAPLLPAVQWPRCCTENHSGENCIHSGESEVPHLYEKKPFQTPLRRMKLDAGKQKKVKTKRLKVCIGLEQTQDKHVIHMYCCMCTRALHLP